ncbi:hypothetical protein [Dictyobacter vulcani]|nr:hypothetical protein [Dictyobacter vulcani]
MGGRTLTLTCGNKAVNVADQLQLLSRLYSGCALPADYVNTLSS